MISNESLRLYLFLMSIGDKFGFLPWKWDKKKGCPQVKKTKTWFWIGMGNFILNVVVTAYISSYPVQHSMELGDLVAYMHSPFFQFLALILQVQLLLFPKENMMFAFVLLGLNKSLCKKSNNSHSYCRILTFNVYFRHTKRKTRKRWIRVDFGSHKRNRCFCRNSLIFLFCLFFCSFWHSTLFSF